MYEIGWKQYNAGHYKKKSPISNSDGSKIWRVHLVARER